MMKQRKGLTSHLEIEGYTTLLLYLLLEFLRKVTLEEKDELLSGF